MDYRHYHDKSFAGYRENATSVHYCWHSGLPKKALAMKSDGLWLGPSLKSFITEKICRKKNKKGGPGEFYERCYKEIGRRPPTPPHHEDKTSRRKNLAGSEGSNTTSEEESDEHQEHAKDKQHQALKEHAKDKQHQAPKEHAKDKEHQAHAKDTEHQAHKEHGRQ